MRYLAMCGVGIALAACRGQAAGDPASKPSPSAAQSANAPTVATADLGRVDRNGRLRAVSIVSRVGDQGPADAAPKHARGDQSVTLYAVLEVETQGPGKPVRTLYSDAPALRVGTRTVIPTPLSDAPIVSLSWSKIEPTEANLSNTASGSFRYETIPYAATPLDATTGAIAADVHPTRTPDHGLDVGGRRGVGTMRYQLVASMGADTVASPGIDDRRRGAAGGLRDQVHRVTIRTDDTFVGFLTEMFGQPYIWASAGPNPRAHQSEHLEGSDCADLMVYGARRAGLDIPYGYTGSLKQHAKVVSAGSLDVDGIYRDRAGRPIAFPRAGDLILFPRHVGALTEDRGTIGVLDIDDLMIHTLFDSPKQQALRDSGYADNAIEILRWK